MPGARCLKEPPCLGRGREQMADSVLQGFSRQLWVTLTGRGTGHDMGPRTRAAHTGTATSCWPLRGWASDPTAQGPGGSSACWLPGVLHLRQPPPAPPQERPFFSPICLQCLMQKPPFLQNPARRFGSETAAPASGFMSGEQDAEFEMECFKTISPAQQKSIFFPVHF